MCLYLFALQVCLWIPFAFAQNYSDGIRLAWDYSQQKLISQGVYARAKLLTNGDLGLVYSNGNNIYFKKRVKGSLVWGNSVVVSRDAEAVYAYTNSELTELSDGTLVYSWNARPGADTGRPYKIMIKFSSDDGRTWKDEQTVYTAGIVFNEGCWEPVVLQLPSGELQLYFANEYNTAGSSQNILMMRSFDQGATWNAPEIISYRNNKRDGMPVPVYLT